MGTRKNGSRSEGKATGNPPYELVARRVRTIPPGKKAFHELSAPAGVPREELPPAA